MAIVIFMSNGDRCSGNALRSMLFKAIVLLLLVGLSLSTSRVAGMDFSVRALDIIKIYNIYVLFQGT